MEAKRSARSEAKSAHNRARGIRPGPSRHILYLNIPVFEQLMTERGKHKPTEIATYLDLGPATVLRAVRDQRPIGDAFVSALAKKLRGSDHRLQDFLIAVGPDSKAAA